MADITNVFKATVKTVKSRNKAQGITSGPDKNILAQTKRQKSEFATKAKNVVTNISQLRDFLLEHRKDYINATSYLGSAESKMTDAERDQIDGDAQIFMRTCSEAIKNIRLEVTKDEDGNSGSQMNDYKGAVITLLDQYLKVVCKLYSEQKAIRVKRVVDRKRIGRLEPESRSRKIDSSEETKINTESLLKNGKDAANHSTSWQEKTSKESPSKSGMPVEEPPIVFQDEDDEISPEEAQMFELENQQLYEEMNSLIDEVKQVEGKVVEITRLQEIFADKVLEQEKDVDRIADTVVGATENIKGANEEIREAMKNNAGLRVWILFFLIVCSFSLLFLDWYNP